MIILIAESSDSKVEFAQKEGFKKLLHLLLKKDEEISEIICKALLHLLNIENSKGFLSSYTSNLVLEFENFEEKV
jgi:hypothetical protein